LKHIVKQLQPLAVDTTDLIFDPANARGHSPRNLEAIKNSLQAFGQRTPIVAQVNDKGTKIVRKGNGTLEAARQLVEDGFEEWKTMAVVFVEEDNVSATGYAIADNRTGDLSFWNDNLSVLLTELSDENEAIFAATGFDDTFFEATEDDDDVFSLEDLEDDTDDGIRGEVKIKCRFEDLEDVRELIEQSLAHFEDLEVK
jgi:hypothetical protein